MQTERRPSVSSRSSQGGETSHHAGQGQRPPSGKDGQKQQQQQEDQNQPVPSFTTADLREASPAATARDRQLPVLTTSRGDGMTSSRRALATRSTVGLQRVYLEGVEYMRGHVTRVEEEADRICREFHK